MFKNLILCSLLLCTISYCTLSDGYSHEEWLDESNTIFLIKWEVNFKSDTINFRSEVKSKSWFSFGLVQDNGDNDIMIGWFDEYNTAIIKDCYSRKNSDIEIDEKQNYNLQWAEKNDTHLIFEFERKLKTCDTYDTDITDMSTNVIIYSYGSENVSNIKNLSNSVVKGKTKIELVSPVFEMNENLSHFDFLMNVSLPDKPFLYLCQIFKVENPIQIIKLNPIISDLTTVHHIIIYECQNHNPEKLDKHLGTEGYECEKFPDVPTELQACVTVFITWTVGTKALYSDNESAFVFGKESKYYTLQIHFENLNGLKKRNITAGLRGYKRSKPRKYALGEMMIGNPAVNSLIIPPNQPEFKVAGHCLADCFPFNDIEEKFIKAVAVTFHMHLRGTSSKLRHFRDGKELPWIAEDKNYLFDKQIKNYLIKPVIILPGDILTVECIYNTLDVNQTTISGHSSSDEMCILQMFYYPRMKNFESFCRSKFTEETYKEITGVDKIIGFGKTHNLSLINPSDLKQMELNDYLRKKSNWKSSLQNITLFNPQIALCGSSYNGIVEGREKYVSYPNIGLPYKPSNICTDNEASRSNISV